MDIRLGQNGVVLNKGKLELTKGRGEALAQRLTIHLRTHFGTWFINTQYGIDYLRRVFEKGIPKVSIDATFQAEINKDVRVAKIIDFRSVIEKNVYKLTFKVQARDGVVSDPITVNVTPRSVNVNTKSM